MDDELQREGTFSFWLKHRDPDWTTNSNGYIFGPFDSGVGIVCRAFKHRDKTLEITLTRPLRVMQTFKVPIPEAGPEGILVEITWRDGAVKLHLNGELVQTVTVPPPV